MVVVVIVMTESPMIARSKVDRTLSSEFEFHYELGCLSALSVTKGTASVYCIVQLASKPLMYWHLPLQTLKLPDQFSQFCSITDPEQFQSLSYREET